MFLPEPETIFFSDLLYLLAGFDKRIFLWGGERK
jgi:hypothetical protein